MCVSEVEILPLGLEIQIGYVARLLQINQDEWFLGSVTLFQGDETVPSKTRFVSIA